MLIKLKALLVEIVRGTFGTCNLVKLFHRPVAAVHTEMPARAISFFAIGGALHHLAIRWLCVTEPKTIMALGES
jgi:hypothetical protein